MISLRSEITKRILRYFYLHDQEELYVNELVRKLDADKRNLVKKLHDLETEGILKSQTLGNLRLYSMNHAYPLYKEYEKIVRKTIGLEKEIKDILRSVEGINEAYIFGSYVQEKMEGHSDIDLLVVGSHSSLSLQRKLRPLQRKIDREINVVDMDRKEYQEKLNDKDSFLTGILNEKHIRVV